MSKFNTSSAHSAGGTSPVQTTSENTLTHEGAVGFTYTARSELFLLAVTNFVSESTFYERGSSRDARYRGLIQHVVAEDGAEGARWISRLLIWLRKDQNLRTASLVGAVELVRACLSNEAVMRQLAVSTHKIGVLRYTIDQVCKRADEPGELLAYFVSTYGRQIPKPIKRGVADAVLRLYTERSLLKYDTKSHAFRFGDVIELTHPRTELPVQGELFRHAIDRRHGRGEVGDDFNSELLNMLWRNAYMRDLLKYDPMTDTVTDAWFDSKMLQKAGLTWDDVLSALGSKVDKARLWEALIPTMGYMALLRNLRNFEQAGVSDDVVSYVNQKLSDAESVAQSRQLPLRFLSAYRSVNSLDYVAAIERALQHSLSSVPHLDGRTLVLIDTSGSMCYGELAGNRSGLSRKDASVIFGLALGQRCANADVVSFASNTRVFRLKQGEALLRAADRWAHEGCNLSTGTNTASALRQHFDQHDRVVILTDEQASDATVSEQISRKTPLYTWNLAGYRPAHGRSGIANRYTFGGLSDASFKVIPLLERGSVQAWPF